MTSTTRTFFVVLALVAPLFLAGCGKSHCPTTSLTQSGGSNSGAINTGGTVCGSGTSGGGPSAAFLFYVDPTASTVNTAGLSTSGTLSVISGITPPATSGTTTDDMTTVNKQFVYIPFDDSTGSQVQGLAITHSSGALTAVPGSPFAITTGAADSVIADPMGRFLFVGNEAVGIGWINTFQIASSGTLTATPGSPFTSTYLYDADSMAVDGTGKFLYAAQTSSGYGVEGFSIDQNTGALTIIPGSPFQLLSAQIHADSSGKYLLGVNDIADDPAGASDPHITVNAIDPTTGAPSPVPGSPFATTAPPFDFVISPNGQFVYVLEYNSSGFAPLEGFQLNSSTGALTPLSGSPFTTLPTVTYCKFDQSGGSLFCDTGSGFTVLTANPTTGALSSTVQPLTGISYYSFAWAVTD
jgi:6-phosphogluconolactonase (cycloisomerase 2 family)